MSLSYRTRNDEKQNCKLPQLSCIRLKLLRMYSLVDLDLNESTVSLQFAELTLTVISVLTFTIYIYIYSLHRYN